MNRYWLIFGLAAVGGAVRVDAVAFVKVPDGDVPMCLFSEPHASSQAGTNLLVGGDSGRVICYRITEDGFKERWSAEAGASVLAIVPLGDSEREGSTPFVAATDAGRVVCLAPGGARDDSPRWSFQSSCTVSTLVVLGDADGDGIPEVAAGGADHRVHLLGGRDGRPLWNRTFESRLGHAYVSKMIAADDLNGDARTDLVVWTWSGELYALSGANGSPIWNQNTNQGFTEALARLDDQDGDGLPEFVAGGNARLLHCCSGRDGSPRWSVRLDRPLRDVVAATDVTDDGLIDCFVVTAGGTVACVSGDGADHPRWTASLGDVGRTVVVPGDLDGDGTGDAVACAENGVTAAFSGRDGRTIWRWQGPDVARTLCPLGDVDGDAIAEVAVAYLDGTLAVLSGRDGGAGLPTTTVGTQFTSAGTTRKAQDETPPGNHPEPGEVDAVPILLYHDILPEAINRYSTSVSDFRDQMDALVEGDYHCVSLDQIADWIDGRGNLPPRPVCITLDGQYEGHHTYAFDILKTRGRFAVSYITTDWIGTANHADWHQIREMDAAGILDVQNHTLSHPSLTTVDRQEAIAQLVGSNEAIARRLNGKLARHHAYPSGRYNPETLRLVRDLGFRTATTIEFGHATREADLMALPRYTLVNVTTLAEFKRWIRWPGN